MGPMSWHNIPHHLFYTHLKVTDVDYTACTPKKRVPMFVLAARSNLTYFGADWLVETNFFDIYLVSAVL